MINTKKNIFYVFSIKKCLSAQVLAVVTGYGVFQYRKRIPVNRASHLTKSVVGG
jgi:hypothetical protein